LKKVLDLDIKVQLRVGVTEPLGWSQPTREAVDRAVELLLGVERPPWWLRWLRSDAEKMKGMRWRVRS
jgi:hypothetical protein